MRPRKLRLGVGAAAEASGVQEVSDGLFTVVPVRENGQFAEMVLSASAATVAELALTTAESGAGYIKKGNLP